MFNSGTKMATCGKYLAYTHSARWSPSPDENTEEEQMNAINMHNQSLTGIHALISHFHRYLCPPEKSVQQHSITSQRVGVCRRVSPTHGPQAPTSWHCCAGRRRHKGTEHGHTVVMAKWLSAPDVRCLGGHSQLTESQ